MPLDAYSSLSSTNNSSSKETKPNGVAVGLDAYTSLDPIPYKPSASSIIQGVKDGSLSPADAYAQVAQYGLKLSAEAESFLSQALANQRTEEARHYETEMANTDLLRAASQLEQLGLGGSNVLQSGGSATPNVSAANVPQLNNANQRFDRQISMANALLGTASKLASAGIYGGALASVRAASGKMASFASHSARIASRYWR